MKRKAAKSERKPQTSRRPQPKSSRASSGKSTGAVFGGPLTAAVFDAAQTEPIGFLQAE